jgi:hypothetical protein
MPKLTPMAAVGSRSGSEARRPGGHAFGVNLIAMLLLCFIVTIDAVDGPNTHHECGRGADR